MEKTGNIINLSDTINLYNIFSTCRKHYCQMVPYKEFLNFSYSDKSFPC